jgi:hypothetical protein
VMVGTQYLRIPGYNRPIVTVARYKEECFRIAWEAAINKFYFVHDYLPNPQYTGADRCELNNITERLKYLRKKERNGKELTHEELKERTEFEARKMELQRDFAIGLQQHKERKERKGK